MSIAVAQAHHMFGLRANIYGNIYYLDEQTILFPSGNQLVRFNLDFKQQRFIPGSEKAQGMTAVCLSPNRRYVAIAEKSDKPMVTIYDLLHDQSKKRKILTTPDIQTNEFVCLAFSPDSRYLIAQGGKPDWTLVFWSWEKGKVMTTLKTTNQAGQDVNQISFNPQDNTQVCVVGDHIFKQFRYAEGNLKQYGFQKLDLQNMLSHAWVSEERVLVGSDTGKVYLFESGEIKAEFDASLPEHSKPFTTLSQDTPHSSPPCIDVSAVIVYSKGFACSGEAGTVWMFEKTGEKEYYTRTRLVKIPTDPHSSDANLNEALPTITTLTVSPSEEMLVAATDHRQLYSISLLPVGISQEDEVAFEPLVYSVHSSTITGLDVCIRKPLVATCSLDHSVRVWNYETKYEDEKERDMTDSTTLVVTPVQSNIAGEDVALEMYKVFQEEALSIALHPSGLYILVGFSDKLRLMNILIDDIRIFKEITIRGCRECAFSNGGHLFAAAHGSVIQIYSSTTFENVSNLKGHNGKVRAMMWSVDDSKLVTCGMDGAVYEWSPSDAKRINEVVLKTCAYSDLTVSPSGKCSYAVGSDKTIKEISESQISRSVDTGGAVLTQIAMSRNGKMLFCGTITGALRVFKFPFTEISEWSEQQGHSLQITKMKITFDDQFLITTSEDACIIIWRICDKDGRGIKIDRDVPFAEEILITKSDLEEKNLLMSELRTRVEELRMENEYQLRLKDMSYNDKIKDMSEKFMQDMEALKTKNRVLKTEKEKEIAKHQDEMADVMDSHAKEMQDLETRNNHKLMVEYEKYHELQTRSQKMQEDYDRQLQVADVGKQHSLEELTEFYETKLQEKSALLEQAQDDARMQQREHEETRRQIEEDADREILDVKNKYERKLRNEVDANLRLKGESGIMRKKFNSLNKEIDLKNEEIRVTQHEKVKLENVIKSLEKDIVGLKKEIQERDETIQDKEKRIYDLKKKNQELEKFKFVLDYKIKELKKQIEPREKDIKLMKEQIQEMEGELERFHKQNSQLDLNLDEQKQKLRATERELRLKHQLVRNVEAVNRKMKIDIHNCAGFIQEPKKLKDSIREMFQNYVNEDVVKSKGLNADVHNEYMRQREHLEKSVALLRKQLAKDTELHRLDNVRIMQENVILIKEINDLRRVLKSTRIYILDLEASLGITSKKKLSSQNLESDVSLDLERPTTSRQNVSEETSRIIEMQRNEIRKLRNQIMDLDDQLVRRPQSSKLPPLVITR